VKEKLYLCVTADELELPLYVTPNREEMAKFIGTSTAGMSSMMSRKIRFKIGKGRANILSIRA
jgi:hypothetical protein